MYSRTNVSACDSISGVRSRLPSNLRAMRLHTATGTRLRAQCRRMRLLHGLWKCTLYLHYHNTLCATCQQ